MITNDREITRRDSLKIIGAGLASTLVGCPSSPSITHEETDTYFVDKNIPYDPFGKDSKEVDLQFYPELKKINEIYESRNQKALTFNNLRGANKLLDVYYPKSEGLKPVIIYFHGGAWVLGNTKSGELYGRNLAEKGDHILISANYQLTPEKTIPEMVDNCKKVITWAKNQSSYPIDVDNICVAGDSAGGHLSMYLATEPLTRPSSVKDQIKCAFPMYAPVDLETTLGHNPERISIFITDLLNYNLPFDPLNVIDQALFNTTFQRNPEIFREFSPLHNIMDNPNEYYPPILNVSGIFDHFVDVQQTREFNELTANLGFPEPIIINGGHGFFSRYDLSEPLESHEEFLQTDHHWKAITDFLEEHLRN